MPKLCENNTLLQYIEDDIIVIDAFMSDFEENTSKIVWDRPQRCVDYQFLLMIYNSNFSIVSHNISINCCEIYFPTRYLHSEEGALSYLRLIGSKSGSICTDPILYSFNSKLES